MCLSGGWEAPHLMGKTQRLEHVAQPNSALLMSEGLPLTKCILISLFSPLPLARYFLVIH